MSLGGSRETVNQPNIPPELQNLLSQRTAMESAQIPGLTALMSGVMGGQDPGMLPYGRSILAPYDTARPRTAGQIARTVPGTMVDELQAKSGQQIDAARGAAASATSRGVLDQFMAMVGAPEYRTGTKTTQESDPGLLDYLTTMTNLVHAIYSNVKGSGGGGGGG